MFCFNSTIVDRQSVSTWLNIDNKNQMGLSHVKRITFGITFALQSNRRFPVQRFFFARVTLPSEGSFSSWLYVDNSF